MKLSICYCYVPQRGMNTHVISENKFNYHHYHHHHI